jgi:peroxiredoxin
VSNDPVPANEKFASECGFSYPLICDESLAVSVAYGAADNASAKSASRIAVLVDPAGKVKEVYQSVDARKFPEEMLARLA